MDISKRLHFKKVAKGFSLVELLVVISIMVLLLGVGSIGLLQNNSGKGLNSSLATVESLLSSARNLAVAKETNARLIINDDPSDVENYRRQMVVVYEDPDPTVAAGTWVRASRPTRLASGTFVESGLSVTTMTGIGTLGTDTGMTFTRNVVANCVYVEFNQVGVCKQQTATNAGATLVLVNGRFNGTNIVVSNNEKAALAIWRNGTSTRVTDPSTIN